MDNQLKLNDIADELLIVNKITIDKLFNLENCTDCIALYLFYYKTAKWQKTNTIKANDTYIKKSLKWGTDRIRKTKQTLKENGLIDIVQRRENGKITGWFVEVSYLVSQKKTEDIKIKVEESNNTQKQQVAKARSGEEETNALKEKIKCLEKEIEILKNNNNIKERKKEEPKKKATSYDEILSGIADEELKTLYLEYIKMRKLIKAPMTDRALQMLISKVNTLEPDSLDNQKELLETAIMNNWKSVYPIKKGAKDSEQSDYGNNKRNGDEYSFLG